MSARPGGRLAVWLRPIFYLGRNRLSQLGVALTTSSAVTLIGFWLFEVTNSKPVHPYSGILFILVLLYAADPMARASHHRRAAALRGHRPARHRATDKAASHSASAIPRLAYRANGGCASDAGVSCI